ncbi:MAG: serine/threonine-protein kinase [Pirellulales bacterium]
MNGDGKSSMHMRRSETDEPDFEVQVDRFDLAWRSGPPPRIADFLPAATDDPRECADRRALLVELIKVDMEYRWRPRPDAVRSSALDIDQIAANDEAQRLAGRRRLDDYLAEFPLLRDGDELLGLVAEEYLVRRRFGDRPTHAEFLARYASQATAVAATLAEVDRQFAESGDDSVDVRGDLGTLVDSVAVGSRLAESVAVDRANKTIRDESATWDERRDQRGSHDSGASHGSSGLHDSRGSAATEAQADDDRPPVTRFVARLGDSGLLSAKRCDEIAAEAESRGDLQDVKSFAASLVAAGRLTDYQADALLRGDARRLVLGEYIVLSKIGEGGMGAVYRARHRRMDRVVALKVLSRSSTRSKEGVQRFMREARTAGRLSHPNIVLALDASEDSGRHYLVMEYVEGVNLRQIVKRRGPLAVDKALAIARQVAEGLACAHAASIIHRDIKPDNVLVGAGGVAKVLDLGLARLNEDAPRDFVTLTSAGSIVGTPEFMPPEQAADPRHVDLRADVYSLGCTLYYMLTGKPPFEAESVFEKLMAHRDRPVPSVRAVREDVPLAVDRLVAAMMAKSPADRPQSMGKVIAAIDAATADAVVKAVAARAAASARTSRSPDKDDESNEIGEGSKSKSTPRRRMRDWAILVTLVSCVAMLIVRLILSAQ